tara:strand:- start:252 stop:1256 length:1005 start_codon:yes stop_codon:yes gene_type:complete
MKKLFSLLIFFNFLFAHSQVSIGGYSGSSPYYAIKDAAGVGSLGYVNVGDTAGYNGGGSYFTNVGSYSGRNASNMYMNVHIGYRAGWKGDSAQYNVAIGSYALHSGTGTYMTGDGNTAVGYQSGEDITSGYYNVSVGHTSLFNTTSGYFNTAVGMQAGDALLTGYSNTYLGSKTEASSTSAINQTMIGFGADGQGDNTVTLGNSDVTAVYMAEDSGATIYAGNATFGGDVTISSDIRLKSNIVSLGSTLSKLLLIDGKSYTMNSDGKDKIGVLAQEVQEVFPELVGEDTEGMLTVNYQGLVPVLINALKEQESKIIYQQIQIDELKELVNKLID